MDCIDNDRVNVKINTYGRGPVIACKNKTDPVIRPGKEEIELYKKWVRNTKN